MPDGIGILQHYVLPDADRLRLLGHRDGIVSALLAVRREIGDLQYRLQRTEPHHTRKRRRVLEILRPLQAIERYLVDQAESDLSVYKTHEAEAQARKAAIP